MSFIVLRRDDPDEIRGKKSCRISERYERNNLCGRTARANPIGVILLNSPSYPIVNTARLRVNCLDSHWVPPYNHTCLDCATA